MAEDPSIVKRRDVLLSLVGGGTALALSGRAGWADVGCEYAARPTLSRSLVKRIVSSPDDTYATYPTSNGFLPDGRLVVADATDKYNLVYSAVDLAEGGKGPEQLAKVHGARTYWAISKNGHMAVPTLFGVKVLDLMNGGKLILDWQDEDYLRDPTTMAKTLRYSGDIDISADGKKVVSTRIFYDNGEVKRSDVIVIDVADRSGRVVVESRRDLGTGKVVPVDHAQFSPFDNQWICYSDASNRALQRMWTWHPSKANPARPLFSQADAAKPLVLTHERALFDKPSMLVVAAGSSPGMPRGLYEVRLGDGKAHLVSESNRDLHCNANRSGGWYVVSLQGEADLEDHPGELDLCERPGGPARDANWLKSAKGYGWSDVILVDPRSGQRVFLYKGANANTGQPYEVQPAVSPDGRFVIIKDARRRNVLALELDHGAMTAFLKA